MLSKEHRFHGYNKLTTVYRKGLTSRSYLMSLKYLPNPKQPTYRLAVVVSRKVHKNAVVRNRIRRRIFEIYRRAAPEFTGDFDMIVTVFSEQIAYMSAPDLQKAIQKQLEQAGIIRSKVGTEPLINTEDVV